MIMFALSSAPPREQHNVQNVQNSVFSEDNFVKNHTFYVHLNNKDVGRFRNRSVYDQCWLKACQIREVYARSHDITN